MNGRAEPPPLGAQHNTVASGSIFLRFLGPTGWDKRPLSSEQMFSIIGGLAGFQPESGREEARLLRVACVLITSECPATGRTSTYQYPPNSVAR